MSTTEVRYVSSRVIIARIANMFNTATWRSNSFIYLGKGIQLLGYNYSTKVDFTPETDLIQVSNHTAEIPCNIEEILEIHYNNCRLPINRDITMLGLTSDNFKWYGVGNYYNINYPYINTSFESGEIKIFYKKFILDDQGYLRLRLDNGFIERVSSGDIVKVNVN